MKTLILGLGYVGFHLGVALSDGFEVLGYDVDPAKMAALSSPTSLFPDAQGKWKPDLIIPVTDLEKAAKESEFAFLALPTDFSPEKNAFDVEGLKEAIRLLSEANPDLVILIKSTVPVGFTKSFHLRNTVFFPEFLRESSAMEDIENPSRIIFGLPSLEDEEMKARLLSLLEGVPSWKGRPLLWMTSDEAESVKLFSNTYLAMRVAFFNELDTYAMAKGMDASRIIKGVGLDPRIGDFYNKPSFGYGGYCLPKDSKQMAASYDGVPETLISATVSANQTRAKAIAKAIMDRYEQEEAKTIGIYRLVMEKNSKNIRNSSLDALISLLKEKGYPLSLYEPLVHDAEYQGVRVEKDFTAFISTSDLIIANRIDEKILPWKGKVFTRDPKKD